MKEEKELIAQCGKKQPFKVPEGYFEQFHEQLMKNLPEVAPKPAPATEVTFMARIKPWLYMAAMFVGTIFVVKGLVTVQEHYFASDNLAAIEEDYSDEEDCFMSSSLYNEYVLYSYLTTYEND